MTVPKSDKHGNYWWGKPGSSDACAILTTHDGKYMVYLPNTGYMFDEHNELRRFSLGDAVKEVAKCIGSSST